MTTKKTTRGGKRAGAGRPAGPYGVGAIVPHRVAAALLAKVQDIAAAESRAPSEIHNEALAVGLEVRKLGELKPSTTSLTYGGEPAEPGIA
jgi:hypothetical protein